MRPTVYYHHVSRIGESMFHLAVLEYLSQDSGDVKKFLAMDDVACMHTLRTTQNEISRWLMGRISGRKLYKRALYVGTDQVNTASFSTGVSLDKSRCLATSVAQSAGVDPHTVLVDIPPFPHDMFMGVRVKGQHAVVSFEEISPRIRTLNETRHEQWRLGVYTLPEQREQVADAAADIFHVKKPTRQDTLF